MHERGPAKPDAPRPDRRRGGVVGARRGPAPADLRALQRTAGNTAVTGWLSGGSLPVQRKGGKGKGGKGKEERRAAPRPEEHGTLPQDQVQRLMLYACSLLLGKDFSGYEDALSEFSGSAARNGLCAGWTRLHRLRPDWLLAVWQSLSSWRPGGTRLEPTEADLPGLLRELKAREVDLPRGGKEVGQALLGAWGVMHEVEPEEGYGLPPTELTDRFGSSPDTNTWEGVREEVTLKCTIAESGDTAMKCIMAHRKKWGKEDCYFHFETAHHVSGVLVSKGRWTVCETEHFGIAQVESSDVAPILRAGCAAGYERHRGDAEGEGDDEKESEDERSAARDRMRIALSVEVYTRPRSGESG